MPPKPTWWPTAGFHGNDDDDDDDEVVTFNHARPRVPLTTDDDDASRYLAPVAVAPLPPMPAMVARRRARSPMLDLPPSAQRWTQPTLEKHGFRDPVVPVGAAAATAVPVLTTNAYDRLRRRAFVFTSYDVAPPVFDASQMRYMCFQREVAPTTGRTHWQGYVEFHRALSAHSAASLLGTSVYVAERRGTAPQAIAYCRKSETADRTPGGEFREYGEATNEPVSGYKELMGFLRVPGTTMEDVFRHPVHGVLAMRIHGGVASALNTIQAEHAGGERDVTVRVFWGATGTGKSMRVHQEERGNGLYVKVSDPKWWDGYFNQPSVLFDDFYGEAQGYKIGDMLQMLDRYPYQLQYKGGYRPAHYTRVYFTSNTPPFRTDASGRLTSPWFPSAAPAQVEALRRRIPADHVRYFPPPRRSLADAPLATPDAAA